MFVSNIDPLRTGLVADFRDDAGECRFVSARNGNLGYEIGAGQASRRERTKQAGPSEDENPQSASPPDQMYPGKTTSTFLDRACTPTHSDRQRSRRSERRGLALTWILFRRCPAGEPGRRTSQACGCVGLSHRCPLAPARRCAGTFHILFRWSKVQRPDQGSSSQVHRAEVEYRY